VRRWKWMVQLVIAIGVLALATPVVHAQGDLDAVKSDVKHHKVEFENDQVRVVRWVIPPGDKTAQHSHPGMVSIYLTDGTGKATMGDGKTADVNAKAGAVAWRGPGTHVVENTGSTPLSGILIEPKKPHSALPAGAKDVVAVDPQHSKVEFENEQVRVIRYHYGPGEMSAMHGHPDNVQVMLTDTMANIKTPDGKTSKASGKAGDVQWRLAGQHAVENTGKAGYEGIVVELKGGAATTASK
jgi:quercetin dioxygenase-like cupin family protein